MLDDGSSIFFGFLLNFKAVFNISVQLEGVVTQLQNVHQSRVNQVDDGLCLQCFCNKGLAPLVESLLQARCL